MTTRNHRVQAIVDGRIVKPDYREAWAELKRIDAERPPIPARTMPSFPVEGKMLYEAIEDGAWAGQRCFIVGGGKSLEGFDFSLLNGEHVIGVNRAYEDVGCDIMFATDHDYYKWIMDGKMGAEAKRKFDGFKGLKVWLEINKTYPGDTYRLKARNGRGITFSMRDGIFHGENSGYGALNLAVCLGANPIYLLGYDMKGENGKQAWYHSGYPQAQVDNVYKKFIPYYKHTAPLLEEKGIKVVNLNPESELRCFEFQDAGKLEKPLTRYVYHEIFDSKRVFPEGKKSLYFQGCFGFGDNFYQRPIIKEVAKRYEEIYLMTAFPEAYWDIPNVRFIYPDATNLRTQRKHADRLPAKTWSKRPDDAHYVRWDHIGPPAEPTIKTKYVELENREDFDFSFPVRTAWTDAARKLISKLPLNGKKLCIVRRPTDRKEWSCVARNPKIEYYQLLIDRYKDEYFFLGLADVAKDKEWFDGELIGLDKEFNRGEIPLPTIMGLMKIADMTITYPSLFMIAAIAMRARCFCVFGGIAGPEYLLRKRLGLREFAYVAPEPPCNCHRMDHDCNKEIPEDRLLGAFEELRARPRRTKSVTVGVPPGLGDSYWVIAKMESFKERNSIDELKIAVLKKGLHNYTPDFLRMFSFVDEVKEWDTVFNLANLYGSDPPGFMEKGTQGVDYFIDFGGVMWKKGVNLEDIYAECATNFDCWRRMKLPREALRFADGVKKRNKGKLVLFYTSSIGNNRNWNGGAWRSEDWISLATRIFERSGVRPILIGAQWDKDHAGQIRKLDSAGVIQDMVGETSIAQLLSLVREAMLVVSFPCGIPMMATYFGIPTVMFWSVNGISRRERFDKEFQFTWVPPKARKPGRYVPVIYDSPEATPEWIFKRIKEFL